MWEVQSTLTNVQIPLGPDFLPDPKVRPPGSFTWKAPSGGFVSYCSKLDNLEMIPPFKLETIGAAMYQFASLR